MGETSIEWATHTLNFLTHNCSKVSQGCRNCYALTFSKLYNGRNSNGGDFLKHPPTIRERAFISDLGKIPAGAVVFVNSHSDTFHEDVPLESIQRMYDAMTGNPDITWLVLTKRIQRAVELQNDLLIGNNIWLGTSVEDSTVNWRLDCLAEAFHYTGRFVSAEPLLGDPKIEPWIADGTLDWVIVGGESGANRRPFDKAWVRGMRDVCQLNEIPFLFKQGSHFFPGRDRELDGRTWDEIPFTANDTNPQQVSPIPVSPQQLNLF